MKATIFSLAAILAPAVVLAQTATTTASGSTSSCAADYIVESCLGTEEAKQEACGQQDYSCQCAAYEAIVTCFNNCPDDTRAPSYKGLVTQYCALATQYASTNSAASATGSASASAETGSATTTGTATGTSTATSSSKSSSSTAESNSGAGLVKGAGAAVGMVAGVVAVLL